MKIRNGFVSNSSSSSFIVSFPSIPKCLEDVQEVLFGTTPTYPNPYQYGSSPTEWSTKEVAETVWSDIQKQQPLNFEELVKHFNSGQLSYGSKDPSEPKYPDFKSASFEDALEEYHKQSEVWATKKATEFAKENVGYFYLFKYSDNDGHYYSALEHGNLFSKLPHVTMSHH
jgi:hypothetical protein